MNRSVYLMLLVVIVSLLITGCTSKQKEGVKNEVPAIDAKGTIANDQQATILGSNITDEISSVDKELDELETISGNGTG